MEPTQTTQNEQLPQAQENQIAPPPIAPPTPEASQAVAPPPAAAKSSAVEIVLQWLTYAMWGASLIALSVLLTSALTYFFVHNDVDYSYDTYVLATTLCLVPVAYVLDWLYARREPVHKHGFAAVVLVVHAVIAFLVALGALITCVVSLLSLAVATDISQAHYVVIISALVIAVLAALLFLRIMNFSKMHWLAKWFPLIMSMVTVAGIIVTIVGPFRAAAASKNDRLIEENLDSLNTLVQDYAHGHKQLPNSLADLTTTNQSGAATLIKKNLVSYEHGTLSYPLGTSNLKTPATGVNTSQVAIGTYQLCVSYRRASPDYNQTRADSSDTYIDASMHPAGRQCYSQTAYADSGSVGVSPLTY